MRPMHSRFPVLALAALALASLSACSERNPIAAGSYTCKDGPLAGTTIAIDASKKEVVLTVASAAPIRRASTAWPMDKWPQLCPRGMKNTGSEVLDLGAEPLAIGGTRVAHPLVVAECLGKPTVWLMAAGADGEPQKPQLCEATR